MLNSKCFCCHSITTVMVLRHSHEFISHHSSHPLDVIFLQLQQYNDALISALTHCIKKLAHVNAVQKINTLTAPVLMDTIWLKLLVCHLTLKSIILAIFCNHDCNTINYETWDRTQDCLKWPGSSDLGSPWNCKISVKQYTDRVGMRWL